jgi:hypothetical protein
MHLKKNANRTLVNFLVSLDRRKLGGDSIKLFLNIGCFRIKCCFSYRYLNPYLVHHRGIFSFANEKIFTDITFLLFISNKKHQILLKEPKHLIPSKLS